MRPIFECSNQELFSSNREMFFSLEFDKIIFRRRETDNFCHKKNSRIFKKLFFLFSMMISFVIWNSQIVRILALNVLTSTKMFIFIFKSFPRFPSGNIEVGSHWKKTRTSDTNACIILSSLNLTNQISISHTRNKAAGFLTHENSFEKLQTLLYWQIRRVKKPHVKRNKVGFHFEIYLSL